VIFDDVTDRAELERRLVQSDKLSSIGLLAAGVAHEVNTPLAVISTYAQMLSKQLGEDDQKARMLDKISKQTFRASEIVNSLLNFSRTSTADLSPVQINRVIQETVSLLEHQFRKSSIEVRLKLDPRVEAVNGNAGKLQQVFLNLFMNARDAMELMVESQTSGSQSPLPPRSILEIATRMGENGIEVDVTDTGNGIAPEHLSRIYDPFFTTKSAKKGTGLGLSVTYGIVQEHHGMIEAVSKPGEGTCFHLEFPPIATPVPTAAAKA
jgi:signal transduction histidine kinase